MKKIIFFVVTVTFALLFSSCTFPIKGEGTITTREIKLNNVKQISAKGSCRLVYLYDNKKPRMIIETHENLIDNLKIHTEEGQLSISESRRVKDADLYNVYIYNPEIEYFELHDQVNIDVNSQLRISKLNIILSDVSKFLGNSIVVDELNVKVKDNAKINLQGEGNKLILHASDASDFSAPFLELSEVKIQLSDVATVELNIKNKLVGKLSDNSRLTVIGNPAKDIKQTDLSKVDYKK
ncbi:MAG: DUF2807 domain-containing protein [Flavobacteriaceae bacterium]|jgi:hypothetical protein|nr:DUF2807 domain-containing protein [Flavobacteriaceae bacterium]